MQELTFHTAFVGPEYETFFVSGGYDNKEAEIIRRQKEGWTIPEGALSYQTCVFGVGYWVTMKRPQTQPDQPLPAVLSPLLTNHPASVAYRVTLSPHEWVWDANEQVAMARALVQRDKELADLRRCLRDIRDSAEACLH